MAQTRGQAIGALCLALSVCLVACAADPGARRTRRMMSEAEELELGRQAARQVEDYLGFAGSAKLNAYVDRIGQRLVQHSARSHLAHEFHVVDMKEPNAFALPGGFIYVSRGLLAIMNSEDELAAVLGHEIGHVAARHSAQQQARQRRWIPLQVLAGIGGAAASVVSPELGQAVAGAGQLPAALMMAKYSRRQEQEADRLGQQYIAADGWDPAALATCMDALTREQKLAGTGDPNRMSFFDTHPTTPSRAREGREYAATLEVAAANRIAADRSAFVARLDGLVLGDSARGGLFVDHRFVHPGLGFAIDFPKSWEHANAPTAVAAQPEDQSALLVLQVAAEGDDPAVVADEVENEVSLQERNETTINGLPAVSAVARGVDDGQEIYVSLTWIAKDELVYQVLGAAVANRWKDHRATFQTTAESFRQASEAEIRELHEDRLRLVAAKPGETPAQIVKRSASQWPTAKLAAANAIEDDARLSGGEVIKVSKRERYKP